MDQDQYPNGYYGRPAAPMPSAATSANITPLRPGTPNADGAPNPFGDNIETASSHRQGPSTNPFASPDASRPASSYSSSNDVGRRNNGQRFFHSRRVQKGEIEKPWIGKNEPKEKWVTILPLIGILIGLGISGFLVWDGLNSVVHHKYCPVMDDDFGSGLNTNIWTKEVEVGGFGYVAP